MCAYAHCFLVHCTEISIELRLSCLSSSQVLKDVKEYVKTLIDKKFMVMKVLINYLVSIYMCFSVFTFIGVS